MKNSVFWEVMLCSLEVTNILENLGASIYPEAGGSRFLWNIGNNLPDYTVSWPRSSHSWQLLYLKVLFSACDVLFWVAFHSFSCHRTHVIVDNGKLHEGEEHEHRAWWHPHVDCFHVRDWRKGLLRLGVLRGCETRTTRYLSQFNRISLSSGSQRGPCQISQGQQVNVGNMEGHGNC